MTNKSKKVRKRHDYDLAKKSAKLKAIKRLVKEWRDRLPVHFELIINKILEENEK